LRRQASGRGKRKNAAVDKVIEELKTRCRNPFTKWENIGGQLIPEPLLAELITKISKKDISSWNQLHQAYDELWRGYPDQKAGHGLYCLLHSYDLDAEDLTSALLRRILKESIETAEELLQRAYESREKDFQNPYRRATFRNPEEMQAVCGKLADSAFLEKLSQQTETYCREVEECLSSLQE
jgi:hypothetical protein